MSARFRCRLDCSSGPGQLEKLAASDLKPGGVGPRNVTASLSQNRT